MNQRVSRPVHWHASINRANAAIYNLRELHHQWVVKLEALREELENLRGQRSSKTKELNEALADLSGLQREYDSWGLPETLEFSRLQGKLDDVQQFPFEHLRENISQLEKFPLEDALDETLEDDLRDEPFIDALHTLQEAKEFDLPKGFGRD